MIVEPFAPPIKLAGFSTREGASTGGTPRLLSAWVLLLGAAATTLGIGFRDPRLEYGYECVVFLLAGWWCMADAGPRMQPMPGVALAAILGWGFVQLAAGATVYRYATLESSLRFAALAATAWISFRVGFRVEFLRVFVWFGAVLAVVSVLAYFTSPGKILWVFDAPYPDNWGPFLSRNNFAQFLELAMPVALWFALRGPDGMVYLCFAAVMLASGLASASRAGACILVLEAAVFLWIGRTSSLARRTALGLALGTVLFAALFGVGHLAGRLRAPDPFEGRREIAHSALAMIAARPWTGVGLGNFATVYPEYASLDWGQTVEHAHNDWLEWTAEGGVAFVAVWISLAGWCARPALRSGWGIGILGCFLHGLVDYPFARFGTGAWIFALLGMLAALELRELRPASTKDQERFRETTHGGIGISRDDVFDHDIGRRHHQFGWLGGGCRASYWNGEGERRISGGQRDCDRKLHII